ncbi:hypothetical protein Pmani_037751 [Petrolisthes manimaculis]|uniref:Spondin domain-containing protein n=1 Tax=Petrolisthes manimaculis TaxID=1843537 RepID=A0AAE1NH72_9EUCA|nr:hypothetical protein Pmani_037751 [Petrolisthes manimaculis]
MWLATAWVTVVVAAWLALVRGVPAASPTSCPPEELTVYKVVLDTHWSPRDFPKHYPEWRPPAQWSKLLGEWEGWQGCIFFSFLVS